MDTVNIRSTSHCHGKETKAHPSITRLNVFFFSSKYTLRSPGKTTLELTPTCTCVLRIRRLSLFLRLCRRSLKRLLKVGDDVVNVFCTDRDADEILQ